MKYCAPVGDRMARRFITPGEALRFQLETMIREVHSDGISHANRIPHNRALLDAYRKADIPVKQADVIDYDPIDEIYFALQSLTQQAPKQYSRTFRPGQGEGTHTDPHKLVVTYTHNAGAFFSIAGSPAQLITPQHIIAFDGTTPHEVSMPLGGNVRRTISAFGVDI
ncbi:hypothetical protein KC992_01865 [Candidatus Saccharibacteria bacterium]|nr:hypothetical protein [Candidatus Saccharibacteria bacterium]